jgi:hypothetical protein
MAVLAALCLLVGILPGFAIDALAPVTADIVGARLAPQSFNSWHSIVPMSESRSSYNGMLVFGFVAISTLAAILLIRRFGSRAVRRAPAWDCGFPDTGPLTQYAAGSFAQPIRRVFGGDVFGAREQVDMPTPGDGRAARLTVVLHDYVWDGIYARIAGAVDAAAGRLNGLQFLTIRRYLSLVFLALVALLLVLAIWQ